MRPHGAQTVGSLDLGGASTQIAFTTTDDASGEGLTKVTLYGYEYTVYTHSFLCFGKNEAEKTVLAKLVQVLAFYLRFYLTDYSLLHSYDVFINKCISCY